MALCVKAFATTPGNLSLIPGTYIVEGENQILKVFLCPTTPPLLLNKEMISNKFLFL